jgi:putative ABC transport system permease protein
MIKKAQLKSACERIRFITILQAGLYRLAPQDRDSKSQKDFMKTAFTFYSEAFKIAMQSITTHKLRAFLTLIGIIIGVASVIVVGASISGLNTYVIDRVSRILGVNHFMIARMANVGPLSEEEWEKRNRRNKRLTWDDYEWVLENCTLCKEVGAQVQRGVDLKQGNEQLFGTTINGVTANMAEIEDKTIADGRYIRPSEVDSGAYVIVIGADVAEKFFPQTDPIGKEIKVAGYPMMIVGIEEKRGSMFGQSLDNHAYIPLTTFGRMFGRQFSLGIHGKSHTRELFDSTLEQGRVSMRIHHKLKGNEEDDFGLVDVQQVNNQVDSFTGAIAAVITPITLISLVVGGIVVMNIMLVSVTERTFEIGLRKALGARRKQIMLQFLIESVLLSSFGGMFGLLLATGISWLVAATTPIPMTITVPYIVLALVVSGGIGMIAGIYPAFRASRLDPIVALTKN